MRRVIAWSAILGCIAGWLAACDDDVCCREDRPCEGFFDYSVCGAQTEFVPVPVPAPFPVPTNNGGTDGGSGNPGDDDGSGECIDEGTPPTCEEHCLTPFGHCVSNCVKERGQNKFGACVRRCRSEMADGNKK